MRDVIAMACEMYIIKADINSVEKYIKTAFELVGKLTQYHFRRKEKKAC